MRLGPGADVIGSCADVGALQLISADMQWVKNCELVLAQAYPAVNAPLLLLPHLIVVEPSDSDGFSVKLSSSDAQRLAVSEKVVKQEPELQRSLLIELRGLHVQSYFVPTLRNWCPHPLRPKYPLVS